MEENLILDMIKKSVEEMVSKKNRRRNKFRSKKF